MRRERIRDRRPHCRDGPLRQAGHAGEAMAQASQGLRPGRFRREGRGGATRDTRGRPELATVACRRAEPRDQVAGHGPRRSSEQRPNRRQLPRRRAVPRTRRAVRSRSERRMIEREGTEEAKRVSVSSVSSSSMCANTEPTPRYPPPAQSAIITLQVRSLKFAPHAFLEIAFMPRILRLLLLSLTSYLALYSLQPALGQAPAADKAATAAVEPLRTAVDRPFDVQHLRLDLRVDLPNKTVDGVATLRIKSLRGIKHAGLDAVGFEVKKVELTPPEREAVPVRFTHDGKKLAVDLEPAWPAGQV